MATTSAPVFDEPKKGLLPQTFFGKQDSLSIDSTAVDSLGNAWFHAKSKKSQGWIIATMVQYASKMSDTAISAALATDADKVRRLAILKEHVQWPRRAVNAIRIGVICLDMTEDQVVASWGQYDAKMNCYMVGTGNYQALLYKNKNNKCLMVTLQNDKVIGWTDDK